MKNILIIVAFLSGIGALIFWLWSDRPEDKTLQQIVSEEQALRTKIPVRSVPDLNQVEISIDENGLTLKKLYNKEVNALITSNEVKDAQVSNGILTFKERENGKWVFKAVHLEQYIEKYLK